MDTSKKIKLIFDKDVSRDASAELAITLNKTSAIKGFLLYGSPILVDGDLKTSIYTTSTPLSFVLCMNRKTALNKIRLYTKTSTAPKTYNIQGSDDNITYTTLFSGSLLNITDWQDALFETSYYRYYKINCTSKWGSSYDIYEVEVYGPKYTPEAFTITAKELLHTNGSIITSNYYSDWIESIEGFSNNLVLKLNPYYRIKNAIGEIEVTYNAKLGVLKGKEGIVESFTTRFMPVGLIPIENPLQENWISASIDFTLGFMGVNYSSSSVDHGRINANFSNLTIEFIPIDPNNV